ncbi:MAG TPA: VOC family protein [Jatrophihabitans sp.]|jgi:methylmalonyl-CoA/ethylmalonyl-CoA epimerase|nr:VOC family protein [Jatrophihabitans sp.]
MILGIDHIGLATDDADRVGRLLSTLGMRHDDGGLADEYGVTCDFFSFAGGNGQPAIELVAPARPDSSVSQQLARRGPGLYHLAFQVDDLEGELARLSAAGFVQIDATPCAGARPGMRVAFLYLPKPAATLIELVHYAAQPSSSS